MVLQQQEKSLDNIIDDSDQMEYLYKYMRKYVYHPPLYYDGLNGDQLKQNYSLLQTAARSFS